MRPSIRSFLAHAAMEPMGSTVLLQRTLRHLGRDTGTYDHTIQVAELTGLPKDAIKIHNHLIGGGFGRRLEADGTVAVIAKHVDVQ